MIKKAYLDVAANSCQEAYEQNKQNLAEIKKKISSINSDRLILKIEPDIDKLCFFINCANNKKILGIETYAHCFYGIVEDVSVSGKIRYNKQIKSLAEKVNYYRMILHSTNSEIHDRIAGKGSFIRSMTAIRHIKNLYHENNKQCFIEIKLILSKDNINMLDEAISLLKLLAVDRAVLFADGKNIAMDEVRHYVAKAIGNGLKNGIWLNTNIKIRGYEEHEECFIVHN